MSTAARTPTTAPTGPARWCEALTDLAVVVLSTWTVVYHLCLLLRLAVPWAVILEILALACWAVVRSRVRADVEHHDAGVPPAQIPSSTAETATLAVTVGAGAVAALLVAFDTAWTLIAVLWLAAALAGTCWAALRRRRSHGPGPAPRPAGLDLPVALAWAVGLAVLSLFTLWPNPDDLYYVNLSQWVADHGTFPLRDTIFSDLVFPMSSWPPIASYDALGGTIARLCGVHAATVVYIGVPPLATFLSVLAMWRLLRAWRVPHVAVALSVALIFLLFDGGSGYAAPGNLFLIRIWQGKVILLCLMVPLLLVYALRYVERPTRSHLWWLFAGGVAAVGLTTTAMFLVPLIALGGAAPLVRRRPAQALQGFAAMAAYPLLAGALTVAVGGRSADLFESRELFRFDPSWFGHAIFRSGPLAVIAVLAVLLGALLVPHRAARVTTGVLALLTGVTFVPGFTHLAFDLVGLGPTLWRVSWITSIAALVGVLASALASSVSRPTLSLLGPLALTAVLVVFGLPIWSEANNVALVTPPHWQRGRQSVTTVQAALAHAEPGDVILSPEDLAVTLDVLTTRVKTVAPRDYFMDYLRDDPAFHFAERLTLVRFANESADSADLAAVGRALKALGVDQVCLPRKSHQRVRFVRSQGYRPVVRNEHDVCLGR